MKSGNMHLLLLEPLIGRFAISAPWLMKSRKKLIWSNRVRGCNQTIFINFAVLFLKLKLLKSLVYVPQTAPCFKENIYDLVIP